MLKMTLKDLWQGAGNWLRSHTFSREAGCQPDVDDEGLIAQESPSPQADQAQPAGAWAGQPAQAAEQPDSSVVVRAAGPTDKNQSIEKVQEGFNKLIEQLQGINQHLDRQVAQHAELMERIEKLPQWLETFPTVVESQKQITEQLLQNLKGAAAKQERFIDAVEKIPTETAKQTDALVGINHQLAAAADTDVQMTEGFNKFNQTLDRLNQTTEGQTDSILQMSRTFATSDRYLKYIITKHNKRFMWLFISAASVCLFVILVLTGIIIYLKS
jgi:soluble cytochrome b562